MIQVTIFTKKSGVAEAIMKEIYRGVTEFSVDIEYFIVDDKCIWVNFLHRAAHQIDLVF